MYDFEAVNDTLSWHHKEFTDLLLAEKLDCLECSCICKYLVLSNNARSRHEQNRPDVPRGVQHVPLLNKYPQFRHLSKLVMSSNEIGCIDVENIPTTVQLLDFDNNMIEHVPDFSRYELHTLQIACNRITHINGDYLPHTITTLHLDGNKLTSIPVMANLLSLKRLYLSFNQIPELSINSLPLQSITHLYLHHNKITHIPNLKCFKTVEVMSLHDNEIGTIEGLPDSLTEITLAGNPLRELHDDCFTTKHLYAVIMKKHTVYFGQTNVLNGKQIKELTYPPAVIFKAELYYRKHCSEVEMSESDLIDNGYNALHKYITEKRVMNYPNYFID